MGFSTAPNGGVGDKIYNVYSPISVVTDSVNNASLLFGIADMGFRLTFRSNYQSFNKNNIVVTGTPNQLYKNYRAESGYIAPQIAWAMAKDLTNNGIKPYVTLDLYFDRDFEKRETAGADTSGNTGERVIRSQNYFEPMLAAGVGGYTFYSSNGFKVSTDLDYALTMKFFDNEYSYIDNGHYKTGKIKGTFSPGILPYVEQSYMLNSFIPSISSSWSSDRLSLRLKLNLPLMFCTEESNIMGLDSSNRLIYTGDSNSTNTFTFRPDIRLAMQYKIVPQRLTLNAGARIQPTPLIQETVNREIYDTSGTKTATQIIHQNSSSGSFISRFHLGAAFNFTENVWLEATTGITNAYGNIAAIDVFAPGGLFSFGSIMFALKF
jgi:hypothetical protein